MGCSGEPRICAHAHILASHKKRSGPDRVWALSPARGSEGEKSPGPSQSYTTNKKEKKKQKHCSPSIIAMVMARTAINP